MGRILSFDIGKKRTGVAATDPLQIIATGITTVETSSLIEYLKSYMLAEQVDLLVVGYPVQTNGRPSESLRFINPVIKQIVKHFPSLKIVQFDERYTSTLAHRAMLDGGMKKKDRQDKAVVDMISATIILQSYMESRQYKGV